MQGTGTVPLWFTLRNFHLPHARLDGSLTGVSVSWCCCNKVAHTGEPKKNRSVFSHSSGGRSLRSRRRQGWLLLAAQRDSELHSLVWAFGAAGGPRCTSVSACVTTALSSMSVSSCGVLFFLCVCLCVSSSHKDTSHVG